MENKVRRLTETPARGFALKQTMLPWIRARELVASGGNVAGSSALVILGALDEWEDGMAKMRMQRSVPLPRGLNMWTGYTGAIQGFSNAILRDERIFHLDNQWQNMYRNQVMIEAQQVGAWKDNGPDQVKTEALQRLLTGGWDAVRPAITTTIRLWIVRGFMEQLIFNRNDVAVEFLGRALELLRWGLDMWKDIPQDLKGAVFCTSFIRGVHALYAATYMKACAKDSKRFPLETLHDEAQSLLESCGIPDIEVFVDPGFKMSFGSYAKGCAYSLLAWCFVQGGKKIVGSTHPQAEEAMFQLYRNGGEAYVEAADQYPKDDEKHVWFLCCALQSYWHCGAPLFITMPIMERVRLGLPNTSKIWEHASLTKETHPAYDYILGVEQKFKTGLDDGSFTMDSMVSPKDYTGLPGGVEIFV